MEFNLEVTSLISPLINTYKAISDEWKHQFDDGIADYLRLQTEKYYLTTTFIHGSERMKFKDIYYPLRATYNLLTTDFEEIDYIFEDYKNITLIGSAGSGKTTVLKYIYFQLLKVGKKIPIVIELRTLNDFKGSFEELLFEKIIKSGIKPSIDTLKRSLKSGKFIFLLDGYDEVHSVKKGEINRQISMFTDAFSKNNFLITTRPGSGIENYVRFYDFTMRNLEDEEIFGFINKQINNEEKKKRLHKVISDPKSSSYKEFLKNPLLLSMFILAFEKHPEIPSKKSAFYRNVFDTLYSQHDSISKNSFAREKLTQLHQEDFEKVLSLLSYMSFIIGRYSFTTEYLTDTLRKIKDITKFNFKTEGMISDLRTAISILILDGFEFKFPHRSMQEYFAAQFVSKLPTDKKNKAYTIIEKNTVKRSNDDNYNFETLCMELDKNSFFKYYIIPKLTDIKNRFTDASELKLLNNLLDQLSFITIIQVSDDWEYNEHIVPNFDFIVYSTSFQNFMAFLNIHYPNIVIDFVETPKILNELSTLDYRRILGEILKENNVNKLRHHKTTNSTVWNLDGLPSEIMEIFLKNNVIEFVHKFKNIINHKIYELENEIKKEEDDIDTILG